MPERQNKATWIWYPGDFEIWLGNIFNNRRTERGAMFPPFWKQDSHYVTVEFSKAFVLDREESITIMCEGQYNFAIDGKLQFPSNTYVIPKGEHKLNLKVWNQATPPALFIQGDTINTDSTWLATYEDKLWIDENGIAHGSGIYVPAASWHFDSPDTPPSSYHLEREERRPVCCDTITTNSSLYDFGKETFGYLKIACLQGTIHIYYGESREEALDKEYCETIDVISSPICRDIVASSKAFRYVYIEKEPGTTYSDVLMDYEYSSHDLSRSGSFRCSDNLLNDIWQIGAYTMDLTTREFFMDGIKRDRWTWSGDAIQSYLMNYYLRFDTECVKRTIRQLRGKDPVTAHVNTIMDYTFYWFKSILDYYEYTGDAAFVREMWPRMVTLMDYVLGRTNSEGMAEGQPDDWIFVDWVDFPMHKRGTLCFEQILLCKALETMDRCQSLLSHSVGCGSADSGSTDSGSTFGPVGCSSTFGPTGCSSTFGPTGCSSTFVPVGCGSAATSPDYASLANTLRQRIKATYWDNHQHAYLHAIEDGVMNRQVTKFPNMFAILYGLSDDEEQKQIMQSVMLNPDIPPITTPYMRFYELEALCMAGMQSQVLQEIRDYWGGMLQEGATSFWEKYVPSEKGTQHLAMYGRPYGKSLCHAWGASPVYLLGKYYLGVKPIKPGYEEFEVRPMLGDLDWMEGDVPTPHGMIHVYMDHHQVKVHATEGEGWLYVGDRKVRVNTYEKTTIT